MPQGLSQAIRDALGPDSRVDDIDRLVYSKVRSARQRPLADKVIDAAARYLEAVSDLDYVTSLSGKEPSRRRQEVSALFQDVISTAERFDAESGSLQEEYIRGVPDFAVREATRKFMDEIRGHLRRHVQSTRASETDTRDVLELAEETLGGLEKEVNTLVDAALWELIQKV